VIFSAALDSPAQRDTRPLTPAGAVPPEVGTAAPQAAPISRPGRDGRPPRPPGDGLRAGVAGSGRQVPVIAVTNRVGSAVPPMSPGASKTCHGLPVDLFDGQAILQGGSVTADEAGCGI